MPVEIRRIAGVGVVRVGSDIAISDGCCCDAPITCASLAGSPLYVTFSGITGCYCYCFGSLCPVTGDHLKGDVTGGGPGGTTLNGSHLLFPDPDIACRWTTGAGHYKIKSYSDGSCTEDEVIIEEGTPQVTVDYNEGTQIFTINVITDSMSFPRSVFLGTTAAGAFTCANTQITCPDGTDSYVSYNGSAAISF